MKAFLSALCLLVVVGFSGSARAQVPVTDLASLTQQLKSYVQTGLQWYESYMQLKVQYELLYDSYQSLTKARSLGDIFDNPALNSYLPQDWLDIYNDIKYAERRARSQAMRDLYASNRAFDQCGKIENEDDRLSCEALAVHAAVKEGHLVPAMQMIGKRSLQLKKLMKKLGETEDLKETAELQGRIDAEQAAIANTQAEMQLYEQAAETEKEILEQEARERAAEPFSRTGGLIPAPLPF
jgi:type IV secretion system protein VirB5